MTLDAQATAPAGLFLNFVIECLVGAALDMAVLAVGNHLTGQKTTGGDLAKAGLMNCADRALGGVLGKGRGGSGKGLAAATHAVPEVKAGTSVVNSAQGEYVA